MKVQTYLFGEVEVDSEKVITFPNGVVAFENNKRFMLVHEDNQQEPSSFTLQSLDDPAVAFQVVDPVTVGFHYELKLTDAESALLQNPAQEDVAVMLILFKPEEDIPAGIGANIRAPLILNTKARVGLQKPIEQVRANITISNLASSV
ncbi:MAG TPA: flagellar assembly protein FliW [Rhodocyclaceae bacterium]|nr:flagellar assembly protein FliW [Rhodocyclaceae bacterium]